MKRLSNVEESRHGVDSTPFACLSLALIEADKEPPPMLTPLSLWISAKLSCHVHSQGGHPVFVFTLALVTAEPIPPPQIQCLQRLWFTVCHHKPCKGGAELRQGSCIVHGLMVHFMCVCVCAFMEALHKYVRELWSESHFNDLFFLSFLCRPPPSLLTDNLPTEQWWRQSGWPIARRHLQSTTLENYFNEEQKTRPAEIPQNPYSEIPESLLLLPFPSWNFTSSFFLQNTGKKG